MYSLCVGVGNGECGLAEAVHVNHEADHGSAGEWIDLKFIYLEGVYGKDVAMLSPRRRRRSTVAREAEVVARLREHLEEGLLGQTLPLVRVPR